MTDIVQRLRARALDQHTTLEDDAADEIERLTHDVERHQRIAAEHIAEVERLRAKIDWRNREPPHCPTCDCPAKRSAALAELAQMDQDMGLSVPTTEERK